ncbi:hypothetical protein DRO32_04450 [Candidatus Bathyarchaeota archaeon]|nr:MAG: hypothetical protein DRO32_04450 [Candidatus Bathyarchaeota archaeon]
MGKIRVCVKTRFGEVSVEGGSGEEVLSLLEDLPDGFLEKLEELLSSRLSGTALLSLRGLVEFTAEGPVIVARGKLSQYEAIGLLLYSMREGMATAARLRKLLEASGIRAVVPARLNEMAKRGLVFKPDPNKHDWKLTAQGERWVEEEVIPRLRGGIC